MTINRVRKPSAINEELITNELVTDEKFDKGVKETTDFTTTGVVKSVKKCEENGEETEKELEKTAKPVVDKTAAEHKDEVFGKLEEKLLTEEVDLADRKALAAAIKECKAQGTPFTVRRSIKEGCRYTLVKNAKTNLVEDNQTTGDLIDELVTDGTCANRAEAEEYINNNGKQEESLNEGLPQKLLDDITRLANEVRKSGNNKLADKIAELGAYEYVDDPAERDRLTQKHLDDIGGAVLPTKERNTDKLNKVYPDLFDKNESLKESYNASYRIYAYTLDGDEICLDEFDINLDGEVDSLEEAKEIANKAWNEPSIKAEIEKETGKLAGIHVIEVMDNGEDFNTDVVYSTSHAVEENLTEAKAETNSQKLLNVLNSLIGNKEECLKEEVGEPRDMKINKRAIEDKLDYWLGTDQKEIKITTNFGDGSVTKAKEYLDNKGIKYTLENDTIKLDDGRTIKFFKVAEAEECLKEAKEEETDKEETEVEAEVETKEVCPECGKNPCECDIAEESDEVTFTKGEVAEAVGQGVDAAAEAADVELDADTAGQIVDEVVEKAVAEKTEPEAVEEPAEEEKKIENDEEEVNFDDDEVAFFESLDDVLDIDISVEEPREIKDTYDAGDFDFEDMVDSIAFVTADDDNPIEENKVFNFDIYKTADDKYVAFGDDVPFGPVEDVDELKDAIRDFMEKSDFDVEEEESTFDVVNSEDTFETADEEESDLALDATEDEEAEAEEEEKPTEVQAEEEPKEEETDEFEDEEDFDKEDESESDLALDF